jgi:hypothetical protein
VIKLRVYRYIYRVGNINGWGDFSTPGFLFAADIPSQPDVPTLIQVDSSSMLISLSPPMDTGGSEITLYELWRD